MTQGNVRYQVERIEAGIVYAIEIFDLTKPGPGILVRCGKPVDCRAESIVSATRHAPPLGASNSLSSMDLMTKLASCSHWRLIEHDQPAHHPDMPINCDVRHTVKFSRPDVHTISGLSLAKGNYI